MKILKKIMLTFMVVLVLAVLGGYIYFDQNYSRKNYLTVENDESGSIPFKWLGTGKTCCCFLYIFG
jgi:uncharacterized protein YxeA